MLDDDAIKQSTDAGSSTPPQRPRYTVITSPITPVTPITPPRDSGQSDIVEGVPASNFEEGFVDYWLLVDSGRGARAHDGQAPSADSMRPVRPAEQSGDRDGKSCRTDPTRSTKRLPVKRKLCLSTDGTGEKNSDCTLVEKTSRDTKRLCKENIDPVNNVILPTPICTKSGNEIQDAQPGNVPAAQATVQPTGSASVDEINRRSFQPYVPLSTVSGQAGVGSYSNGDNHEKSVSHNAGRVIPEMFNTSSNAEATRVYDYSMFYNGSFPTYQNGTWIPYNVYNPSMYPSGLAQGSQHTSVYNYHHFNNAPYQVTSSSGCTMSGQSYGSALYTQSHSSVVLPELSQFMNTGAPFKGNGQQLQSVSSSFAEGAQGYQYPYYNTYAGTGSNDAGNFH